VTLGVRPAAPIPIDIDSSDAAIAAVVGPLDGPTRLT
jgi:hypothetical protein